MSIIERTSPLNLQYKVCVVTNASTPLGVVICKTLLKANALVLGVDKNARDHSLNAGLGTHFQFEERDINDSETPEQLIEASKKKFDSLGGKFDALINLVSQDASDIDGLANLTKALGTVMKEAGQGSIIVIPGTVEHESNGQNHKLIAFTQDLMKNFEGTSIRTNLIAPISTMEGESGIAHSYEQAKMHMTALIKTERPAKDVPNDRQTPPRFYDIANLALFLAGSMSEDISGQVLALDGSHRAL